MSISWNQHRHRYYKAEVEEIVVHDDRFGDGEEIGKSSLETTMSHIPHPSSTRTPLRAPSTPSSPAQSRLNSTTTPSKVRAQSAAWAKTPITPAPTVTPQEPTEPKP
jgi:hypothetical protein